MYEYLSSGKTNQVLRLERDFAKDYIYIGDSQGSNFVTFERYLKSIRDRRDRQIKESEIKKLVEW